MNLAIQRIDAYLSEHKSVTRVVLWGAGQLGYSIAEHLKFAYPEIQSIDFVDSSIIEKKRAGNFNVYPVKKLPELDFDCLIVASIAYEHEIYQTIKCDYPALLNRLFTFETDPILNEVLLKPLSTMSEGELKALAFKYPERIEVWTALFECTEMCELNIFKQCIEKLSC